LKLIAKMTHSEDKARDYFRFHLFRRTPSRYVYFPLAGITFIGAVAFLLFGRIYYAFFLTFISVMILVIRRALINTTVNSILKKMSLADYNYSLHFSEEKLTFETSSSRKEYLYEDLLGIVETKRYFYFYVSKNAALILLKTGLKDGERTELETFLRQKKRYRYYNYR
jgi:hypothetical protein